MDLLPKTSGEFGQSDYWNAFFKKRGQKAFEWYGEYLELCDQIHKYIKPADKILMLGCGNSKLSSEMYDSGFCDITNIDISPIVIKKMTEQHQRTRPRMAHLQMDATAMTFESEMFSVAVDKATLDALFVDNTNETRATVEKYFSEILRTMRNGGRYLCITLLQEYILEYLLEYFTNNNCMLRVVYCPDIERANREKNSTDKANHWTMAVFVVIVTKFKSLPAPIIEFSINNGKMQRMKSPEELINAVASIQKAVLVCNGLARSNLSENNEITLELCKPIEDTPRYTLHILDQTSRSGAGKFAAFIVPQGREVEWLFATVAGRKKLHASAKYQRLAVVTLKRDQHYESLDAVKSELAECIKNLAPSDAVEQIPFLSLGTDLGTRETLLCGFSKISGEFRIEEVILDNNTYRRLIFLSNQFVVQSEALIKTVKPRGKKERKKIDVGYLACQHHVYMSIGAHLATKLQSPNSAQNDILVVGLGGGGLCTFLHAAMPHVRIVAVEIDPIMLEIAEQFFELKQDKRFHVVIDDGIAFLERCITEDIHFSAVLFDVDSKDYTLGISCPPLTFLAPAVLSNVKRVIGPKGLFILNLVCRDDDLRTETLNDLQTAFDAVCCYKLNEDVNEVIYCSNDARHNSLVQWQKVLGNSGRGLNTSAKEHNLVNDDLVEVTEFLNDLKI